MFHLVKQNTYSFLIIITEGPSNFPDQIRCLERTVVERRFCPTLFWHDSFLLGAGLALGRLEQILLSGPHTTSLISGRDANKGLISVRLCSVAISRILGEAIEVTHSVPGTWFLCVYKWQCYVCGVSFKKHGTNMREGSLGSNFQLGPQLGQLCFSEPLCKPMG